MLYEVITSHAQQLPLVAEGDLYGALLLLFIAACSGSYNFV